MRDRIVTEYGKRRAPACQKVLGPSTLTHTVWETVTKFCTVIKLY